MHLDTAYQSSRFVCHHLSLSLQRDSNSQTLIVHERTLNYLVKFNQWASLAKWLSVCLRTTWLWVRILLQSSRLLWARSSLTFRQLQSAASCSHLNYRVQIHSKMRMWHVRIHSLFVILAIFLSVFSCIHSMSTFFSRQRHLSRGHRISCPAHRLERTDNKPFMEW